jgi:hypothetical protein
LLAEKLVLDAIGVFEVVRRFFRYLNLKPFLLEDFLVALQTVWAEVIVPSLLTA